EISVRKAADRGPRRHQQGVLELHVRRREIGNAGCAIVTGQEDRIARPGLQALDSLGRSRMLKQNQFDSDPPRKCARDLHPALFRSPVAGSFTYCGGNSPKRSLPALTMSATRVSGVCCARVVVALASNTDRTREILEILVIKVLRRPSTRPATTHHRPSLGWDRKHAQSASGQVRSSDDVRRTTALPS